MRCSTLLILLAALPASAQGPFQIDRHTSEAGGRAQAASLQLQLALPAVAGRAGGGGYVIELGPHSDRASAPAPALFANGFE